MYLDVRETEEITWKQWQAFKIMFSNPGYGERPTDSRLRFYCEIFLIHEAAQVEVIYYMILTP